MIERNGDEITISQRINPYNLNYTLPKLIYDLEDLFEGDDIVCFNILENINSTFEFDDMGIPTHIIEFKCTKLTN